MRPRRRKIDFRDRDALAEHLHPETTQLRPKNCTVHPASADILHHIAGMLEGAADPAWRRHPLRQPVRDRPDDVGSAERRLEWMATRISCLTRPIPVSNTGRTGRIDDNTFERGWAVGVGRSWPERIPSPEAKSARRLRSRGRPHHQPNTLQAAPRRWKWFDRV